jgi:hypothetical protein
MKQRKSTSYTRREQVCTNERILKILELLDTDGQKGGAASLQWEASDELDAYQVSFHEYSIRVVFINDSFSQDMYTLMVYKAGRYIDSVSNSRLDEAGKERLTRIYEFARRTALRIDHTLDDVLDKLQGLAGG